MLPALLYEKISRKLPTYLTKLPVNLNKYRDEHTRQETDCKQVHSYNNSYNTHISHDSLEKVERIVIFDEVPKMPNKRENYEGIVKRGLKEAGTIPLSSLYVTFLDCKEVYGVE